MNLLQAIEKCDYDKVNTLIKQGTNVNAKNYFDQELTPLHYAVKNNSPYIIKLLVDNNANLEAKAFAEQLTPLHLAASLDFKDCINELCALKADLNSLDKDGLAPIDYAVLNGNFNSIILLLDKGAMINKSLYFNVMDLMDAAAKSDNVEFLEALYKTEYKNTFHIYSYETGIMSLANIAASNYSINVLKFLDEKIGNIFSQNNENHETINNDEEAEKVQSILENIFGYTEEDIQRLENDYYENNDYMTDESENTLFEDENEEYMDEDDDYSYEINFPNIIHYMVSSLPTWDELLYPRKFLTLQDQKESIEEIYSKIPNERMRIFITEMEDKEIYYEELDESFPKKYVSEIDLNDGRLSIKFDEKGDIIGINDWLNKINQTLEFIKSKGVDLNKPDENGNTVAMKLIKCPAIITKIFMQNGVKFTSKELHEAIKTGYPDIVQLLIENKVEDTYNGIKAVDALIQSENDKILNQKPELISLASKNYVNDSDHTKVINFIFSQDKNRKFGEESKNNDSFKSNVPNYKKP